MATNFLDLPAELRIQIYRLSLSNILGRAVCACTQQPRFSGRFATLWSLHLTSRQINADIKVLFQGDLARYVCFYFDHICKLYDFQEFALSHPALKEVWFNLRSPNWAWSGDEDYILPLERKDRNVDSRNSGIWTLVHAQPGPRRASFDNGNLYQTLKNPRALLKLSQYFKPSRICPRKRSRDFDKSAGVCEHLPYRASSTDLLFIIHKRSDKGYSLTLDLCGKLKNLTFEGIDIPLIRAHDYQTRDSPWFSRIYDSDSYWEYMSPDLDEDERNEMDADSWGVPDRRSSEASSVDAMEYRWQLAFGRGGEELSSEKSEAD